MRLCPIVVVAVTAVQAMGTAVLSAGAQTPVTATVDAAGRVVIGRDAAGARSRARPPGDPCQDVAPLSPEAAKLLVTKVAGEEGFFPDFVVSVAKIESHFRSTELSGKGAYGLMQLMPETAQRFGVDLCDPTGNVRGGIRLLRMLHERYRNPFFILAAYNAGEEALLKSKGVPPYPETVRFVADVINDFYAWPATAPSARPRDVMAAATVPSIVEVAPAPAAPAALAAPSAPAAPPPWSDGFVID